MATQTYKIRKRGMLRPLLHVESYFLNLLGDINLLAGAGGLQSWDDSLEHKVPCLARCSTAIIESTVTNTGFTLSIKPYKMSNHIFHSLRICPYEVGAT